MKTLILQQALEELKDAIDYYEELQNGLGLKEKYNSLIELDRFKKKWNQ